MTHGQMVFGGIKSSEFKAGFCAVSDFSLSETHFKFVTRTSQENANILKDANACAVATCRLQMTTTITTK